MTKVQFSEIKSMLTDWRNVRHLSVESQKKNFKVNYAKELIEFFEAERDGNEYEMIDAICDMMVVAINAGHTLGYEDGEFVNDETTEFNLTYPYICDDCMHLLCLELIKRGYNPYECLLETIKELNSRKGTWVESEGKWVKNLGAYTKSEAYDKAIEKFGDDYAVISCVEVPDRFLVTWYKIDSNQELELDKWYKADYSKCKL